MTTANLPVDILPEDASESEIRDLVLSSHSAVRAKFLDAFPTEVDEVVDALTRSYAAHRHLERVVKLDRRAAYVLAYTYAAFNALLSSANLLLSGLQLPAGNLMRHYGEASAMALLCSHPGINAFDMIEADDKSFPYHKALELVSRERNRQLLDLRGKEWHTFKQITQFYDRYSHASFFSVASQFMFSRPGMLAVLGEYDPDKAPSYRIELTRRRTGARVLAAMVRHLAERMPRKPTDDSADGAPAT